LEDFLQKTLFRFLQNNKARQGRDEMSEKFVTVYTNVKISPVDMVKSALESESILCNIKGYDSSGEGDSLFIEIQVPEKDKKKAEDIIRARNIK
jgi:hypothetical protein